MDVTSAHEDTIMVDKLTAPARVPGASLSKSTSPGDASMLCIHQLTASGIHWVARRRT
ncbi:hypothetical protein BD311DRAFT_770994 [Dichomitus squalens]|uniref:Uncharacterized protein n=1 Tax=Dichomitus squalens TaxID=114155 RepID=A0A4Q9M585_9APHY|nr:hypothetical protein BD311DRAFT_770994 [Dichomitus squalens]TBU53349.1 hypothetical protein BD310DRAFT_938303 [Dichomitus squalens]